MTVGMQKEKSSLATAMRMSDVVAGFFLQAVATSDAVNSLSVLGAALVTGSILIIVVFKPKDEAPAAPVVSTLPEAAAAAVMMVVPASESVVIPAAPISPSLSVADVYASAPRPIALMMNANGRIVAYHDTHQ
jgi:hypothetical protein